MLDSNGKIAISPIHFGRNSNMLSKRMNLTKNHELVSVIIPFYNEETFLEEAVESVLNQTFRDWEIILVDDGSTDKSSLIAQEYSRNYPHKIRYISHKNNKNKGLTATRNLGVLTARGEIIALLDADDVWLPNKLEYQLGIMHKYPELALVCSASLYWSSWDDPLKKDKLVHVGGPQNQVIEPGRLSKDLYPLNKGVSPCPCSMVLRKSAIQRHGGFEESFTGIYQMYEDQAFLSKLYLHEKIFIVSECLDKYRLRPNSLVSTGHEQGRYRDVRYFYLNWYEAYLKKTGIQDEELWKLLRKALNSFRRLE